MSDRFWHIITAIAVCVIIMELAGAVMWHSYSAFIEARDTNISGLWGLIYGNR